MTPRDTHIIEKYTGHRINPDELTEAAQGGGVPADLVHGIWQAIDEIQQAESELIRTGRQIDESIRKLSAAINAEAHQRIATINPIGELQAYGPRFDLLIAVRQERIAHLCLLTHLWQRLSGTAEPNSLTS